MFERAWIRGHTAAGCRKKVEIFARELQFIVNLFDTDEDDDDQQSSTTIVAWMQKNGCGAKDYKISSSELIVGFAINAIKDGFY